MKNTIERCELAPDFSISRVLTGLWQIADMERNGRQLDLQAAAAAMGPYVQAGFTTFDMADHYGSAEEIAGLFRKEHQDVQLFTKWVPKPGPVTRNDVRTAVQRSLDRMRTDALDCLQFHAWNYADPVYLDGLFWLQEMKEEGLIRHLGVTNVDTAHLRMILNSGVDIISNQVCFSLLDRRAAAGMTALCQKHGIKILAFGTVAGGFLTENWLGKSEPRLNRLQTWSQMKYKRFIDSAGGWKVFQNLLETLDDVARKHNVSIANIACRFILDEPAVGGIIIGARLGERDHLSETIRLFQISIDTKSRSVIEDALSNFKPIPGDCGDEYRRPPFLTASGDLSHHLDSFPLPYKTRARADGFTTELSGTAWKSGYGPEAVRRGDRITVSCMTAFYNGQFIGGMDCASQMHFILDRIEGALLSLAGHMEDVIKTRVIFRNPEDRETVFHIHDQRFRDVSPASTFLHKEIGRDGVLVEMEAEAVVSGSGTGPSD